MTKDDTRAEPETTKEGNAMTEDERKLLLATARTLATSFEYSGNLVKQDMASYLRRLLKPFEARTEKIRNKSVCKARLQGDEYYCHECGIRWAFEEPVPESAQCYGTPVSSGS